MMMQERPYEHLLGSKSATRQHQGLRETRPTPHQFRRHAQHDARNDDHVESLNEKKDEENQHIPAREEDQEESVERQHNLVLPRRLLKLRPEEAPSTTSNTPRNRSPYSRSHLRSRSSGAAFSSAPAMTRAHSSPSPASADFLTPQHATAQSQQQQTYQQPPPAVLRTPVRQRSPFASSEDHPRPRSPRSWEASGLGIASIQEDVPLDIPLSRPLAPLTRSGGSLRRSRPASPLHSVTNAMTSTPLSETSSAGGGSPMLGPMQRYYSNETYPTHSSSTSNSSVPSTPTSWMSRSRSPSISSLETIEDAGEELEMKEAEAVERLREAADAEGMRRSSSFDGGRRGSMGRERKRWSVCGGERRGDLDLETIWED